MKINDTEFALFINELIEEKVKVGIQQELAKQNYVRAWVAKVVAVGTGTANVTLVGDNTNILTNKKNKTGVTLAIGDEVYLYSPHGSLSTSYIAIKK